MLATLPHIERQRDRLAASRAKKEATRTEALATSLGVGLLQIMDSEAAETRRHGEVAIQGSVHELELALERESQAAGAPRPPAPATAPHPDGLRRH